MQLSALLRRSLAVLLILIAISKVPFQSFRKGMKPVIFLVIFTALLNLFYTSDGTVLWSYGILTITVEGIWRAGFMVARILMLIACTLLLTYTTSPHHPHRWAGAGCCAP